MIPPLRQGTVFSLSASAMTGGNSRSAGSVLRIEVPWPDGKWGTGGYQGQQWAKIMGTSNLEALVKLTYDSYDACKLL